MDGFFFHLINNEFIASNVLFFVFVFFGERRGIVNLTETPEGLHLILTCSTIFASQVAIVIYYFKQKEEKEKKKMKSLIYYRDKGGMKSFFFFFFASFVSKHKAKITLF